MSTEPRGHISDEDCNDRISEGIRVALETRARGDAPTPRYAQPFGRDADFYGVPDAPTPEPGPTLHFTGTYPQRAVYLPVYGDAPTPEPLREAAQAFLDMLDAEAVHEGVLRVLLRSSVVATRDFRAALAATESPDTRALDVDRLARALRPRHLFTHDGWNCADGVDERAAEEMARIIAAEYAALPPETGR